MKKYFIYAGPHLEHVEDDVFQEFVDLCPEGYLLGFPKECRIEAEDPRLQEIEGILDREQIAVSRTENDYYSYGMAILRAVYEPEPFDLIGCEYVRIHPFPTWGGGDEGDPHPIGVQLTPPDVVWDADDACFAAIGSHRFGVRGRPIREAIEGMAADEIDFLETVPFRGDVSEPKKDWLSWADQNEDPVYALDAKVKLPPLHPKVKLKRLFNHRTGRVEPDAIQTITNEEELNPRVGLHYRRADLEKLGSFDVAQVRERLDRRPVDGHMTLSLIQDLVISRRFHELLLAFEPELIADPVFIGD